MSFFERERETRSSIPVIVFLALLSSLSFFQKSDDETAFQIPPGDAREKERERESKEKLRDDAMTKSFCGGRARHQNSRRRKDGKRTATLFSKRKKERSTDERERENE